MISALIILLLSVVAVKLLTDAYQDRMRHAPSTFYYLFAFHTFFFLVYYLYALSSTSDSFEYYRVVSEARYGSNWLDYYGTGTAYVNFLAFPLVNYFRLSYEAVMLFFSLLGYFGFFYFYLFITERTAFRHRLWGVDFILLLLYLPNMHFWTVSLGKGSLVFFGLGLVFYGLNAMGRRWLLLLIGGLVVFHVRAHMMLIVLIAVALSVLFSSRSISLGRKLLLGGLAIAASIPALNTFLEYAKLDSLTGEATTEFLTHRGGDLAKATSGIDINNYNQLEKVFAFLFRPLFIDAPGALGLIVSFENIFYLFLAYKLVSFSFVRFIWRSHWIYKVGLLFFLGGAFALAQVSGNLGLAIRQKTQVMYLFFFVLLAYADHMYRTEGRVVIGE